MEHIKTHKKKQVCSICSYKLVIAMFYTSQYIAIELLFKQFLDQRTAVGGYTNYDAFLSVKFPQLKEQGQNVPSYDELLYKGIIS